MTLTLHLAHTDLRQLSYGKITSLFMFSGVVYVTSPSDTVISIHSEALSSVYAPVSP